MYLEQNECNIGMPAILSELRTSLTNMACMLTPQVTYLREDTQGHFVSKQHRKVNSKYIRSEGQTVNY